MRFFWQKKTQPTITATTPAGAYIATKGTPSGIEPSQDVSDYTYNVVGESFRHDHLVQLIQNHKAVNAGTIFTSATLKNSSTTDFWINPLKFIHKRYRT